jgi:hypothetical protein
MRFISLLGIVRGHYGTAPGAPNHSFEEKLALELCRTMAAIPPHGLNHSEHGFLNQGFVCPLELLLVENESGRNKRDFVEYGPGPSCSMACSSACTTRVDATRPVTGKEMGYPQSAGK